MGHSGGAMGYVGPPHAHYDGNAGYLNPATVTGSARSVFPGCLGCAVVLFRTQYSKLRDSNTQFSIFSLVCLPMRGCASDDVLGYPDIWAFWILVHRHSCALAV